jgi:hypothetical protein
VYQYFVDGSYERVREFVSGEEAVKAFMHYSNSAGAMIGTTVRVILTDGGDYTNMEWIHGKGITYPPELAGARNHKKEEKDDG